MSEDGFQVALWLITVVPVSFLLLALVLMWWR
jgi:hypothetical protein